MSDIDNEGFFEQAQKQEPVVTEGMVDAAIQAFWGYENKKVSRTPFRLAIEAALKDKFCDNNCVWTDHHPDCVRAQKQEPVAKVVSTAPKQIWLDLGFDPSDEDEISFNDLCDATWSRDNATGYGIEYVRADLTSPPQRQPLTDEQIKKDFEKWAKENYVQGFEPYGDSYHNGHTRNRWQGWLAAHRAIEAAHGIKEKNT